MRISSESPKGVGLGTGALGFKRLLWFDLLTTAYMDVLGLLPSSRKELELVYYDCRDISFDDVGLSPRMVEAILSEARRSGVSNLERLSDILAWLSKRNFEISLCVDKTRSQEPGVMEFLNSISRTGGSNVAIYTKAVPGGSMHKKALVTPISVLQGSANLTQSAAARNEEIIDHCFVGTAAYAGLKANVDDTFHGSERWHHDPPR
jgi:hypothetical protein